MTVEEMKILVAMDWQDGRTVQQVLSTADGTMASTVTVGEAERVLLPWL